MRREAERARTPGRETRRPRDKAWMTRITRRKLLAALAATAGPQVSSSIAVAQALKAPPANPAPEIAKGPRFAYQEVVERARRLADQPFQEATSWRLPAAFDKVDYDAWREIRFKPEQAMLVSGGGLFRLETFHLGFLYRRPVTINLIRDGIAAPIPYSTALFDYGRIKLDQTPPVNFGFAGFRLHYPLNDPHVNDEVISFLGASYFRFLGREQKYGLSARALCVEAGTENESFPFFREFWIETPGVKENRATIYGLIDGKAATGAFRFDLTPGQDSELEVQATLFPRQAGLKFGFAPLTSMFLAGENDHRVSPGFRAELHDSDGLLIRTATDEWLWRPLSNPTHARTTSFMDNDVKGFGLLQRDRTFESYQDLDLAYESRPSYFIEPIGSWGAGRVRAHRALDRGRDERQYRGQLDAGRSARAAASLSLCLSDHGQPRSAAALAQWARREHFHRSGQGPGLLGGGRRQLEALPRRLRGRRSRLLRRRSERGRSRGDHDEWANPAQGHRRKLPHRGAARDVRRLGQGR